MEVEVHAPLCKLTEQAKRIADAQERIAAALEDIGKAGVLTYDAGKQ